TQTAIAIDVEQDDDDDTAVVLADLIGEPLVNGKILCPFHDDHTPSLTIFDDHFHCFVCEAHPERDVLEQLGREQLPPSKEAYQARYNELMAQRAKKE